MTNSTTRELRSELSIAAGLLKKLQAMARTELKTPGNSMRWGPVDLEATNALDSLSTAPTFSKSVEQEQEQERECRAGAGGLAAEVAASVEKAVDLAQDPEDKLACLDAAVHVSRLQRALL
ncbi:hypothetical protein [Actinocorallia aurantiaca]|uniref:Uncharacterized protein n=1 Tax=Actinocorallia aurantiaca TaxID=46204 RepID=A0ABN3UF37_9ACTN